MGCVGWRFHSFGFAGAWTGFSIASSYVQSPTIFATGTWFACQFGAIAVAQYGLQLWDGSSNVLFDSGTPAANFTRAAQNWTFEKIDQSATTYLTRYYSTSFDFSSNEFQMVNQFGMQLVNNDSVGRSIGTWWDWQTNKLWTVTGGFSNPIDFQIPALFARRSIN